MKSMKLAAIDEENKNYEEMTERFSPMMKNSSEKLFFESKKAKAKAKQSATKPPAAAQNKENRSKKGVLTLYGNNI
jgi:hypothetical protein